MIIPFEIDNTNVNIFISNCDKSRSYEDLVKALMEQLSDSQWAKLLVPRGNNNYALIYSELINEFKYLGFVCKTIDSKCICGVRILHNHLITNKDTGSESIIGSTCKSNWTRKSDDEFYCEFCDRKKTQKENCVNCAGKKNIKNLFTSWKKLARDKVTFGKYKNLMSYARLTDTNPSYCEWVINKSDVREETKRKIFNHLVTNS